MIENPSIIFMRCWLFPSENISCDEHNSVDGNELSSLRIARWSKNRFIKVGQNIEGWMVKMMELEGKNMPVVYKDSFNSILIKSCEYFLIFIGR